MDIKGRRRFRKYQLTFVAKCTLKGILKKGEHLRIVVYFSVKMPVFLKYRFIGAFCHKVSLYL
jgi:hypothetical protein